MQCMTARRSGNTPPHPQTLALSRSEGGDDNENYAALLFFPIASLSGRKIDAPELQFHVHCHSY